MALLILMHLQRSDFLATKDYSSKQEKLIADYLDWERVVASGARACHPGDIRSDLWLGECKTHVTSGNRLKFVFREWQKIQEEAISKFRFPVLFVDEGSQTVENTWCMLDAKTAPVPKLPEKSHVISKASLFLSSDLILECDNSEIHMLMFEFNGRNVLVLRLSTFKSIC